MIKFSLIIPVYNTKKEYFQLCVDSIIRQTYRNFEAIIIDDGSDKNHIDYYKKSIKSDNRFRIIFQENKGVSVARNKGVEAANGDYILFVDSDDCITENQLEKMVKLIRLYKNNPDIIMFEHFSWHKQNEEEYVKVLNKKDIRNIIMQLMDENNWLRNKDALRHFGSVWNKCYRRKFIININANFIPGIKYCEDVLYSIKTLVTARNVIYTNFALYQYRVYGKSTFDKYNENADEAFLKFIKMLREMLIEEDIYKSMLEAYFIKVYTSYQYVMTLKFFNKMNKDKFNRRSWINFNNNYLIREMLESINIHNINLKGKLVVLFAKYNIYLPVKFIYKLKSNIRK